MLTESHFGLDFDWNSLGDVIVAVALSVKQKKIYMNAYADKFSTNVGLKNFTVTHDLVHWVLHRNLTQKRSQQIERATDLFTVYPIISGELVLNEFVKLFLATFRDIFPPQHELEAMADKFRVLLHAMRIRLPQYERNLIYGVKDGKCHKCREEFLENLMCKYGCSKKY